ncbi:MAG: PQQ-binding-like beta-propeller repeat protein, partial [Armatimonadota bacterium]
MKHARVLSAIIVSMSFFAGAAPAADWPMWRCDARRSATTTEELAPTLQLQWVREWPALEPAWPDQSKMRFDVAYEPVVMGKTMFVGSPRTDSVTALDTDTGAVKWVYYADGPVRFAPVAWQGKLYFVSDDGHLHCLDAATGALRWKVRGGPSDRRVLGNKRLICTWPARGAPVLEDGRLYFAAGIWPFMGIFIHAVDPKTGDVLLTNDGTGATYMLQPHSSPAFAGVAPQGYIASAGGRLLIAGGRSVPACFSRDDGELLYYRLSENGRYGGYHVSATARHFFNDQQMFNLATGERMPDLDCTPVVTDGVAYGAEDADVHAYDLDSPKSKIVKDTRGRDRKVWSISRLWSLDGDVATVWLKAGSRLYASTESGLKAIDLPRAGGEPSVSWEASIDGTPAGMLAADGKLFVTTLQGRILCFGPNATEPTVHAMPDAGEAPAPDRWTTVAGDILRETGATEGYCLLWGLGTGRLAEELARQSALHIVAVDPDAGKVDAARRRLVEAGLYGSRVAVQVGDPLSFDFPPYMASLIVSEDLRAAGVDSRATFAHKLFHALRPYGGTACLAIRARGRTVFRSAVERGTLPNAEVRVAGGYTLLTRAGALPGSANWTHQYADVANTAVSRDQAVRAPLGLLWFGG